MKEERIKEILQRELTGLKENAPLSCLSFVGIGGRARYFFVAQTRKDLIKSHLLARSLKLPHLVVGQASNILFPDKGFRGLVILNQYRALSANERFQVAEGEVLAPSGISLLALVKGLAELDLGGLEFLATIPGTLGGAIVNNAGAFSKEIRDVLVGVNVLQEDGKIVFWPKEKLKLSYRHSLLKEKFDLLGYPLILEAKLKLERKPKAEVKRLVDSYFLIRQKTQPREPSLGCVFKNPKTLKFKEVAKNGRISAGYLIDKAGLKGKRRGRIKISEVHANFFVNLGRGKAKDYLALMEEAKKTVKDLFGILLEEEISIIKDKEEDER